MLEKNIVKQNYKQNVVIHCLCKLVLLHEITHFFKKMKLAFIVNTKNIDFLTNIELIKDEVLLTVGCPIFPPFYIDSQISVHRKFKKNRSIAI